MANESPKAKTVWVPCPACSGANRRHLVLFEKSYGIGDEYGYEYDYHHQLLECMGCDSVKYKRYSTSDYYRDQFGRIEELDVNIWPNDGIDQKRSPIHFKDNRISKGLVPDSVLKIYRETIIAVNADARTLAGGGLRATVEAICKENGLDSGSLQNKIDALAKMGLLTTGQAELLHEERYIGNAALHELATPSLEDIEDGLQIVEGLITTLYLLPVKADRLKKRRSASTKKKSAKSATKKKP